MTDHLSILNTRREKMHVRVSKLEAIVRGSSSMSYSDVDRIVAPNIQENWRQLQEKVSRAELAISFKIGGRTAIVARRCDGWELSRPVFSNLWFPPLKIVLRKTQVGPWTGYAIDVREPHIKNHGVMGVKKVWIPTHGCCGWVEAGLGGPKRSLHALPLYKLAA